jgi:CMP-N,N'-diacetyllegionaminic acid synthase
MKALVIGYGSIGRRHAKILQKNFHFRVDIVTQQTISQFVTFGDLQTIDDIAAYDYYVIATETQKHRSQLHYLERSVVGKKILVEKPLYDSLEQPLANTKNQIFVGYNLRFKAVMEKTRDLLANKRILFALIHAGQFLPTWRKDVDYRMSYSADISRGGGVLRDLSHELDYIQWLFGKVTSFKGYNRRISSLQISSDDIVTGVFETDRGVLVNITMDYISKRTVREITIHLDELTIIVDLIDGSIVAVDAEGVEDSYNLEDGIDDSYVAMHRSILELGKSSAACSYNDGVSVMKALELVQNEDPFNV